MQPLLGLLEGGHLRRVFEVLGGQLDAAGGGAGLGDPGEGVLLLLGRGLHRAHQVGHQVIAALELGLEVGPALLGHLVLLDQLVVLLAGADSGGGAEEQR